MEYCFQWKNEHGNNVRGNFLFSEEADAWHAAFRECGWNNRISLGLIGNCKTRQIRNGIVKTWFDAMSDPKLHRFNTLYLSFNETDRLESGFCKITEI